MEKHPLRFLFLAALVVVIAMLLLVRPWRNESARIAANRVASSWLLICSLGGMFLLYLWLATRHIDTQGNWNVLLLNPLYLAAIFFLWKYPSRARWLSIFIIGSTLLAAVGGYLSGQNMLAPLVFFVPSLLAASILLWPGKAGDDSG